MTALALTPVVLALLILGAHFLRAGNLPVLILIVGVIGLIGVRRPWAARTIQVVLVLGGVEWVRTLVILAGRRMDAGQPATRLIAILAGVALGTLLSALLFLTGPLRRRYFGEEPENVG